MSIKKEIFEALEKQVPENAAQYCFDLWAEDPFHFIISRSRSTKLGDFRYRSDRKIQTITINHDLNPFQFLITFIHEVAHHRVYSRHGRKVSPHGQEWKSAFRNLMVPMLSDLVFPKDVLIPLRIHMANPKASTGGDIFLSKELRKYDLKYQSEAPLFLTDIKPGETFSLRGRIFQKEEVRRTRVLCLEIASGRKYLVSGHAEIERVEGE
jgi:hypothetical protein